MSIERAAQLFAGNTNAVGTEAGGCKHLDDPTKWNQHLNAHFEIGGPNAIGVYPMVMLHHEWTVRWGCIDFDEGEQESLTHARNVAKVLKLAADVDGFVERSRSKGYHVWVFAKDHVPASLMRQALLAACQIVKAPTKEINPKQTELAEGQLGNYVRLPYPGRRYEPGGRRGVLGPDGFRTFEEFIDAAWEARVTPAQLRKLALRYQAPVKKPRAVTNIDTAQPWKDRLDPLSYIMIYGNGKKPGGPLPGSDRSSWLWKLVNRMVEANTLTENEMLQAAIIAHDLHCPDKFAGRVESEMERMLHKAIREHE